MAFVIEPRLKETTTVVGTGNPTLAGAVANFDPFSRRCVNNDTFPYMIVHQTLNEWEGGLATYISASNSFTRTVWHSSNADALVNFSAGTKDVFCTIPGRSVLESEGGLMYNTKSVGQRFLIDGSAISILAADFVGVNATGNQPFFPAGQDAFTLEAGTAYIIEGHISTLRTAGAVSHTTGVNFGGTATFTMGRYSCHCRYGARAAATPVRPYTAEYKGTALSTNQIVQLAATTVNSKVFNFDGMLIVNAAGTLIPQRPAAHLPSSAVVTSASLQSASPPQLLSALGLKPCSASAQLESWRLANCHLMRVVAQRLFQAQAHHLVLLPL